MRLYKLSGGVEFNKLANRLKGGDEEAAEEIFNYFSKIIFRFFMARTSNRNVSEDLTQDVFLKVIAKIDTFDENLGNFTAWIWQIARNSLIDYFRSKKEVLVDDLFDESVIFREEDKIKENLEERIKIEKILQEVKKFSEAEQEIFSLHYISDLSYREISAMTGKTEGTLRVIVHRVIKK